MRKSGGERVSNEIKWLARGANNTVKQSTGYCANGFRFHMVDRRLEKELKNNAVVVI